MDGGHWHKKHKKSSSKEDKRSNKETNIASEKSLFVRSMIFLFRLVIVSVNKCAVLAGLYSMFACRGGGFGKRKAC